MHFSKDTHTTSHIALSDTQKILTVSAEVHEQDQMSLSSNESDHNMHDTSLSSDDDVAITLPTDSKSTIPLKQINSLDLTLAENGAKEYHDSPSSTKRKIFRKTRNFHVEEPDEQTGQLKHDQGEYVEEMPQTPELPVFPRTAPRNVGDGEGTTLDKASQMYEKSLKQADSFLGHHLDNKWPPDGDDCSV